MSSPLFPVRGGRKAGLGCAGHVQFDEALAAGSRTRSPRNVRLVKMLDSLRRFSFVRCSWESKVKLCILLPLVRFLVARREAGRLLGLGGTCFFFAWEAAGAAATT